ncbi:MAG: lytic transglycosylase domain-containing protein [Pseudomonadales bacterium]|nr:lytic transglycosylase domain-containing protein [Pseudomonadales bacterium]
MSTPHTFRPRYLTPPRAVLLIALLIATTARAAGTPVSVPVYLEYPLMRQLLVSQLFNTPDGTREILNDPTGCRRIVLSNPRVGAHEENVEIIASYKAQLGVEVFGSCKILLNREGDIAYLGEPVILPGAKSVKLEPRTTWITDSEGDRIASGPLWDAAVVRLVEFFGGFVLNMGPYTDSLAGFLPEVLPNLDTAQLQATINSLAISDIQVTAPSLNIAIAFEVETPAEKPESAAPLTPEELAQAEAQWQMMDALLVGAVKRYAAATELKSLHSALLDILVDSRYRLRDALTEPADRSGDAVRNWFIESWHKLNPVVREIALQQQGQEQLLWMSTLTASDALYALNQLGSTIGLEISTEGLRRLARMINAEQVDELLRYSDEVDPQLQELLREDIDNAIPDLSSWHLNFSFFASAHAAAPWEDLEQWLPAKKRLNAYVRSIEKLLESSADKAQQQQKLDQTYRDLYGKLVLATAWQESCWRQYVVINKRIEPLRSSTGDIGLMQVNETVWRGFYDLQKLRWDINYNGAAGSEILLNYLVRYALKRGEHKHSGGTANLARASYSAYNGGPGQVSRYRSAKVAAYYKKIDTLFWDKYQQVDAGKADNVAQCLGADLAGA